MNDAAHFLFIVGTLSTGLIAVLIIRAMLPKFFNWFRKTAFPVPKVMLSTITAVLLAVFVVSKDFPPGSFYSQSLPLQSPYVTLYSPSAAATLNDLSNTLSSAQYRAGFALTSVTNVMHDFTAPTNAVFCDLGPGVHDEAFWIPLAFNPEGTATNSRWGRAVCAAPSGMVLLDDVPDRLAPTLPDLSGAVTNRILSVLQTPSGLLPPNAGLWHAPTTNGSFLITWQKVFLGRNTNAVADLQLELFQSGDFIYRLHLDEGADASSVSNWLIAAQDNGGGEVFAFAEGIPLPQLESDPFSLVAATNLISSGISLSPQTLELRWTSFGELDPNLSDNDGDNLTDWEEIFIHHTDPGNPDTDADGLWDGEEMSSGCDPLDPDSDNDGIADGIDEQPLIWNDADDDSDGDGLDLAFELLYGLNPATNEAIDSDGDGWEDWKEIIAGTNPNSGYSTPLNSDGSYKIFDVTFTLNPPVDGFVVVRVGDHGMVLTPTSPTCTLTLREGVVHDVSLFTAKHCTASLSASIASSYAAFQNPHAVFSGPTSLPGKWAVASGMIAQPVPDIEPELICFHDRNAKHVEALISPEMRGSYFWWSDGSAYGATGKSIDLLYAGNDTVVEIAFTATGATSARVFNREVFRCSLLGEHPEWLDPEEEPESGMGTGTGEPWFEEYAGDGLLVAVNNDDDDASGSADTADTEMAVADNDLFGYYPIGHFTGQCCPCPEHQVKYSDTATLISASSRLALYTDAGKTNAFTGTINAGEVLYVEGLTESPSVGAEEIVWQYSNGGQTHQLTNVFTVLSQRIFGDLDFNDEIDAEDKALHGAISTTNGWVMAVATNFFRMAQLRTDVDLPGIHTLSLSGDNTFRVWQSGNPGTTNAPLLVEGQTVTNGVNGVSWGMTHTANVYIQAITNGTATLTYSYIGTGVASGIVCRAALKMMAFVPDIDVDTNNDADFEPYNNGEDVYEEFEPGLLMTVMDPYSEGSGQRHLVKLSPGFSDYRGVVRLEQVGGSGAVRAWTSLDPSAQPSALPMTWDLAQEQPPLHLWVQGTAQGDVTLAYSILENDTVRAVDCVRLTVLPPASYSPGGGSFAAIWAPLKTMNNLNIDNNVNWTDANRIVEELAGQGWSEVTWYEDTSGDTDLDLGTCTVENYLNMRNAGVMCVTASHGDRGGHSAVYAPYTTAGRQLIQNWCSNQTDMVCLGSSASTNGPGYYYAKVYSEWMSANWKTQLDTNRAITVWSICYSATASTYRESVKEAAGGRWRIGYLSPTSSGENWFVNDEFLKNMNGKLNEGSRRTAGAAYDGGLGYTSNVKMDGNPWTTLCPTLCGEGCSCYPLPTVGNRKGWGCLIFDTYMDGAISASQIIDGNSTITNLRWVWVGTGKRALGFNFDKMTAPWISVDIHTANGRSEGVGGGRSVDFNGTAPNGDVSPGWAF